MVKQYSRTLEKRQVIVQFFSILNTIRQMITGITAKDRVIRRRNPV